MKELEQPRRQYFLRCGAEVLILSCPIQAVTVFVGPLQHWRLRRAVKGASSAFGDVYQSFCLGEQHGGSKSFSESFIFGS